MCAAFKEFVHPASKITVFINHYTVLVGGFNPIENYARQIGSFPQARVKKKTYLKTSPVSPIKFLRLATRPAQHTVTDCSP